MHQSCSLHWEEIKTKNPGAKYHLCVVCVWGKFDFDCIMIGDFFIKMNEKT